MARPTAAEKRAAAEEEARQAEAQGNPDTDTDVAPDGDGTDADGTDVEATEGTDGTEGEVEAPEAKAKRPMPIYGISEEALDELPDAPPAATRDQMFIGLLTPIVDDESKWGKWFKVATYKTPTGAREAEKAIERAERPLPEGEWNHAARRILPEPAEGETTAHNRWSALFFQYMGPVDPDAVEASDVDGEGSGEGDETQAEGGETVDTEATS